jgi:hypothetical protein
MLQLYLCAAALFDGSASYSLNAARLEQLP